MTSNVDLSFPAALPHGKLEMVFDGIFHVTGTTRPTFMGMDWQFSRNMTVVREGDSLTLINTVRLDDQGLATLDSLGTVRNVVRIGAFHGMDDPFYVRRYDAVLWGLDGMVHEHTDRDARVLGAGGAFPFSDASVFSYATSKLPEGMILVARADGVLVACDSLQTWAEPDEFFDAASAERMASMGFFRAANVGPGFRSACEPRAEDFERVLTLPFRHLLSAHGAPLRDEAKPRLRETFAEIYGI